MIDPQSPPLRKQSAVRASVDKKLGRGTSATAAQAAEVLTPVERVEWLLAELINLMAQRSFHLWAQDYAQETEPDFLRALEVIAEEGRKVNPKVADVLRWTVQRGYQSRDGSREEAPWEIVPEVWIGIWDQVWPFADATVSRWPKDLDPLTAKKPRAYKRKTVAAQKKGVRFPKAVVKPMDVMHMAPAACYALWKAGASDDALDSFFEKTSEQDLATLLLKWVKVKGDPTAAELRETLHPLHPLQRALGPKVRAGQTLLAILPADQLEPVTPRLLEELQGLRIQMKPKRSFAESVKATLAQLDDTDPNLVVMDARDFTKDAPKTALELLDGFIQVVVCGENEHVAALEKAAKAKNIPVHRPSKR